MKKENMKVVLTGATGQIGRVTAQLLVDAGYEVIAVDRTQGPVPSGVHLHVGDLSDLDFLDRIFSGAEAVIHLGAIPSPRDERGYEVFSNNVNSAFAVFSASANAKCRVVAYASSLSAYGTAWSPKWTSPQYAPMDESHPLVYSESYALSKEVNELSALMWSRRCETTFIGLRIPYTNSAGATLAFAKRIKSGEAAAIKESAKILWAYLDTRDAAAALELCIQSKLKGAHIFNFTAPDTMASETTDKLFADYHPATVLHGNFSGYQSPVCSDLWLETMDYAPRYLINRQAI
jgi:nucleoside-diphosphate-sugar epimerase